MSDTKEITRDQQLLEEFKAGLDKDGPIVLAQRIAELEADRDRASDAVATVQAERDALLARAETAEAENKRLTEELDASDEDGASVDDQIIKLTAERDAAIARADAAAAAGQKAAAKVKKLAAPKAPRKLGPLPEGKALAGEDLVAAIADADHVEIAFSDGKRELASLAPIAVTGEAWRRHAFGLMLSAPVHLDGPAGNASTAIAGYALLLDGDQVAWCARAVPLAIAPGQKVTIADDILF
ncbi:MAG: hypothetical protein P0Y64_02040 [Candidatus Sphingomonas colombiensis]|nr:hypothetical protein [Sphingomonas sp.]WEK43636.1 MAG: hypothetical protein P0Y64_02040 [Sphingomonas sp.]